MPFPFSITGRFSVVRRGVCGDVRSEVTDRAADLLWERSDDVEVDDLSVTSRPSFIAWFSAPGGNWHPMVPFDRVRLVISGRPEAAEVCYKLSTLRMLCIVSGMAIAMGFFVGIGGGGIEEAIKIAVPIWVWIFGMNFITGWIRGPRWLRRKLSEPA